MCTTNDLSGTNFDKIFDCEVGQLQCYGVIYIFFKGIHLFKIFLNIETQKPKYFIWLASKIFIEPLNSCFECSFLSCLHKRV